MIGKSSMNEWQRHWKDHQHTRMEVMLITRGSLLEKTYFAKITRLILLGQFFLVTWQVQNGEWIFYNNMNGVSAAFRFRFKIRQIVLIKFQINPDLKLNRYLANPSQVPHCFCNKFLPNAVDARHCKQYFNLDSHQHDIYHQINIVICYENLTPSQ